MRHKVGIDFSVSPILPIFVAVLLATAAAWLNWLAPIDRAWYDFLLRAHVLDHPGDISIVTIDEDSLHELGAWPWDRKHHAALLAQLQLADIVVFDIIFAELQSEVFSESVLIADDKHASSIVEPKGDQLFAQAINHHGRVVLPMFVEWQYSGFAREILPAPIFANTVAGIGHVNLTYDEDGIARSLYLFQGLGTPFWPSLGLAAAQSSGGAGADVRLEVATEQMEEASFDVHSAMLVRPRLVGPPSTIYSFSYRDVLNGAIPAEEFRGKIVFVGSTARGLGDDIPSPFGAMSGVEFQANLYHAIKTNGYIKTLDPLFSIALVVLFTFLGCFYLSRLAPSQFLLAAVAINVGWLISLAILFLLGSWWIRPVPLLLGIAVFYPLWSWRKIEMALGFLKQELLELKKDTASDYISIATIREKVTQLIDNGFLQTARITNCVEPAGPIWPEYVFDNGGISTVFSIDSVAYKIHLKSGISSEHAHCVLSSLLIDTETMSSASMSSYELVEKTISEIYAVKRIATRAKLRMNQSMIDLKDAIVVADMAGKIVFANRSAISLLSVAENDSLFDLGQSLGKYVWSALVRRLTVDNEFVYQEIDGPNNSYLLCQAVPVMDESGVPDTLAIAFTDVTQLRHLERSKNEALAFLSHDMRSPIVSQLSIIERVKLEKQFNAGQDIAVLDKLAFFAEKSLKFSEDFLQLSRAENLDQDQLQVIDMHVVVDGAYTQTINIARQKGVELTVLRPDEDCWIMGDAQLLERALINLLANAIQYSPTRARVTLALDVNESVTVQIADQGVGIDQSLLPHLFEPYFRAEEEKPKSETSASYNIRSTSTKNYGLGLSFVHSVVVRLGGSIDVSSKSSRGTEFRLSFPAVNID